MVNETDKKKIVNKKSLAENIMEERAAASKKLSVLLEGLRVRPKEKGEPFSHTTKVPSGCYYVGEDIYETFMTTYCNAVNKGVVFTLTERPGAYGPLRTDFDFKATLDFGLKRQYTEEMLVEIVRYHQQVIKASVSAEEFEEKMLWCVVLEKKAPRVEEGKVKDGFHLHFPYFICEPWFQDEYMRAKVNEMMIENKIWANGKFIEPVEKFIDTNMARKQWLMYGSAKDPKAEPFLATKCFDENGERISLENVFKEKMEGRKSSLKYYLPRFMSIRGYNEQTILKAEIDARRAAYKTKGPRKQTNIISKKRSMEEILAELKEIENGKIMEMLSDDRADNFDTWMDVGWTLFNIGQGCDEALEMWITFSKRSEKFEEGACEEAWGKMDMRGKTIGSLFAMAKSDNPDAFNEWKKDHVRGFLYRSLFEDKPNEWDVAQAFYRQHKDQFLCADGKKDLWYEFKEHRWQQMDDGIAIRKLLATEMVDMYYELKVELANRKNKGTDEERAKLERQDKRAKDIITALKTCAFQDKIVKMCKIVFHDPTFLKKMDENKLLFCCQNGVIDLELGIFRDGRPDDYCTFSCNLIYKHFSKEDDERLEMKEFFRKVFPDHDLRRYFKDTGCAAMEGGNKNKTFIVGTGGGDNAKSITYKLLELMFGEYCIKFPREMLVIGKSNSSGSARPELARVRGRRLALVQEIAKDETLNIGVLKELTGNDSFFARSLFEKGAEIQPFFTLMMQCLTGDTPVALEHGFSMPISSLKRNNTVLAWDLDKKKIIPAEQTQFLDQGKKKCVTLVLQDGTEVTCTPDHRFLDANNVWVEAKDIILGETELQTGHYQPCYDIEFEGDRNEDIDQKLSLMKNFADYGFYVCDVPSTVCENGHAPHFLKREYLAGLFGCRGTILGTNSLYFALAQYTPMQIITIQRLLREFGIKSTIENDCIFITERGDVIRYIKTIGARYNRFLTSQLSMILRCDQSKLTLDHISNPPATIKVLVVDRKDAGEHQVYDITVEKPYSNFLANGIVSHNCNEPPAIPGHDDATWNRVRRLDYESKFVRPTELHKYPVPESREEQFAMKRFHADPDFGRRLPELAQVLLSMFFDRYKKYKKTGLREPEKVRAATMYYRASNDVYLQFIEDKIEAVIYPKNTPDDQKCFLKLADLHAEFTSWYKETHTSYSKEKFDRIVLAHEFGKRFSGISKMGKTKGWYGYRIVDDEHLADDKQKELHNLLARKPNIKTVKVDEKGNETVAKPKAAKGKGSPDQASTPPSKVAKKEKITEEDVEKAVSSAKKTKSSAKVPIAKAPVVPKKKIVSASKKVSTVPSSNTKKIKA